MLQSLNVNISMCLERADQAREQAAQAVSDEDRAFWLDMAQTWQDLIDSYEFQQRLNRFVDTPPQSDDL